MGRKRSIQGCSKKTSFVGSSPVLGFSTITVIDKNKRDRRKVPGSALSGSLSTQFCSLLLQMAPDRFLSITHCAPQSLKCLAFVMWAYGRMHRLCLQLLILWLIPNTTCVRAPASQDCGVSLKLHTFAYLTDLF